MSAKETEELSGREAVEQVVMFLLSAKPEQRAAEANTLLGYMSIPAMSGYVWDELCRTRKNKPLPGLTVVTDMIDSQGKKHLRSGQDPALQILALASVNQGWMRVLLGSKQKKVLQGVIAVLGDLSTSLRSKENAAWILRRVTELSDTAKTQFAGQRENLVVAAKMLVGGYRRMGRTQSSSSPTTEVISDSPSEGPETSECESSPSAAKLDAKTQSPTIEDKKGTLVCPLPQQKDEGVAENAGEHGEEPAQSAVGQSAPGGSEVENTGGLPVLLGECADPFNMSKMSLTGMTNTGVMFAEETTGERHTIEGNCCMALAQSALKDGRYLR